MDESHILALDMQKRFLSSAAALSDGSGFEAAWQEASELGLLLALAPDELGGLGTSGDFRFGFFQQRGELLGSVEFGPSLAGAWTILANAGREDLIDALGSGAYRIALPTFPEAIGSYPALRRLELSPKGADGFTANGTFDILRGIPVATHILLPAWIGSTGEPALVLLPVETEGLHIDAFSLVDGAAAGSLKLEQAEISANCLLVRGSRAEALWQEAADVITAAVAAEAVGVLQAMLDQTVDFIRQRKQFGQPIGSFQAIQHRAAEMLVEIEQVRALALAACKDPGDAFLVSAAKTQTNSALQHVADGAVQFHGGIGTTEELSLARYFRRAMALRAEMGNSDQHYARIDAIVGRQMLESTDARSGVCE